LERRYQLNKKEEIMAFNRENLSIATNNMKAGSVPSLWAYYNEDGDSVIASEYFEEQKLTVGDLINVYDAGVTGSKMYRVSAKSTDTFKATVIAHAAQVLNDASVETVTMGTALYQDISVDNSVSLLVTSAANTSGTFTASATGESFITLSKDIADNVPVVLTTTDTLPDGLALVTTYYTVNSGGSISSGVSSKKCQLSETRGGDPVTITDAGDGTHTATVQKNIFKLADGYPNQRKIIKVKTDGGVDAVITPDNLEGGDIITASDALDSMELIFADDEWQIIKNNGVAIS
jgi:hypothetical protein